MYKNKVVFLQDEKKKCLENIYLLSEDVYRYK